VEKASASGSRKNGNEICQRLQLPPHRITGSQTRVDRRPAGRPLLKPRSMDSEKALAAIEGRDQHQVVADWHGHHGHAGGISISPNRQASGRIDLDHRHAQAHQPLARSFTGQVALLRLARPNAFSAAKADGALEARAIMKNRMKLTRRKANLPWVTGRIFGMS
jgi:hypothetical protein